MKIKTNCHSIYDKIVQHNRKNCPTQCSRENRPLVYTSQSCGILLCKCERFPRGCPPCRWRINSYARPLTRFKCRPKIKCPIMKAYFGQSVCRQYMKLHHPGPELPRAASEILHMSSASHKSLPSP